MSMIGAIRLAAFVMIGLCVGAAESPYLILPDGTRFFPIGLYGFPQDRTDEAIYREAHEAGFNFLVGREARFGFLRSFDLPGGPPDPDSTSRRFSLLDLTYNTERKRQLLADIVRSNEST